jgi:CDP-glucose 4,6-dehydratase
LIPDILRAFENKKPVVIRNPYSTRPWQHVLEPLSGYLMLAERLYAQDGQTQEAGKAWAEGWNFGPRDEDAKPVEWIVEELVKAWGDGAAWQLDLAEHPHEANYLKLDISKAKARLGWQPVWNLREALARIVQWHQHWLSDQAVRELCLSQIHDYVNTRQQAAND